MLKFIASTVVAGSFALSACHNAAACGGSHCGCRKTCAPAPAAACDALPATATGPSAMLDMPDMPPTPPATAQNGRSQYRSYSYDPAPTFQAPATRSRSRTYSKQHDQYNAGRKIRGF